MPHLEVKRGLFHILYKGLTQEINSKENISYEGVDIMGLSKKILGVATAGIMAGGLLGFGQSANAAEPEQHKIIPVPQYQHAPIIPGQNTRDEKIFTEFEGIDTVINSMYNYDYEDGYFSSPRLPWDDDVNTHMLWVPANGDGYLVQVIDFQGKNDLYDEYGAVALIDGPVVSEGGTLLKKSPDGIIDYVIRIEERGWYNTQEKRIMNHLAKGEYNTFDLTENVFNQEGMNISRVMQHNYRAALTTLLAWAETGASVNDQGRIEVDVQVYPRYFDYYFGPNSLCNPFYNYGFHCSSFWGPWIVPPQRWCPTDYHVQRWHVVPPRHHDQKPTPPRRSNHRVKPVQPNRRDVISRIRPSTTIDDNLNVRRTTPRVIDNDTVRRLGTSGTQPETRRITPGARPSGQYTPNNNPSPILRPSTAYRPEYKPLTSRGTTQQTAPTYKPRPVIRPRTQHVTPSNTRSGVASRTAPRTSTAPRASSTSSSRNTAPRVRSTAPRASSTRQSAPAPRAQTSSTASSKTSKK